MCARSTAKQCAVVCSNTRNKTDERLSTKTQNRIMAAALAAEVTFDPLAALHDALALVSAALSLAAGAYGLPFYAAPALDDHDHANNDCGRL